MNINVKKKCFKSIGMNLIYHAGKMKKKQVVKYEKMINFIRHLNVLNNYQ